MFCTVVLVRVDKCMLSFLRKHRNETGTLGTKHQRPIDAIHFDPNCTRHTLPERMGGPCAGEKHRAGAPDEKDPLGVLVLGATATRWWVVTVLCG